MEGARFLWKGSGFSGRGYVAPEGVRLSLALLGIATNVARVMYGGGDNGSWWGRVLGGFSSIVAKDHRLVQSLLSS